jgi:hypothetical protein
MDGGTVNQDLAALSDRLMREEHAYLARWLALGVLMSDEVVCADTELYGRLAEFQDQQEQQTRAKYGVA